MFGIPSFHHLPRASALLSRSHSVLFSASPTYSHLLVPISVPLDPERVQRPYFCSYARVFGIPSFHPLPRESALLSRSHSVLFSASPTSSHLLVPVSVPLDTERVQWPYFCSYARVGGPVFGIPSFHHLPRASALLSRQPFGSLQCFVDLVSPVSLSLELAECTGPIVDGLMCSVYSYRTYTTLVRN